MSRPTFLGGGVFTHLIIMKRADNSLDMAVLDVTSSFKFCLSVAYSNEFKNQNFVLNWTFSEHRLAAELTYHT